DTDDVNLRGRVRRRLHRLKYRSDRRARGGAEVEQERVELPVCGDGERHVPRVIRVARVDLLRHAVRLDEGPGCLRLRQLFPFALLECEAARLHHAPDEVVGLRKYLRRGLGEQAVDVFPLAAPVVLVDPWFLHGRGVPARSVCQTPEVDSPRCRSCWSARVRGSLRLRGASRRAPDSPSCTPPRAIPGSRGWDAAIPCAPTTAKGS